ncbi:MAG: 1-deoxy-D-xylulose-5-phosphate reductoisomerase [Clostridia bacterium]
MKKKVCILGATGSIGKQALAVCKALGYQVVAVSANKNHKLLRDICSEHLPAFVALLDNDSASAFNRNREGACAFQGEEGIRRIVIESGADIVLNAIVGSAGILPTATAIRHAGRIALANKETLVSAGKAIMEQAKAFQCEIIPVDSEHSAVFQALQGNRRSDLEQIILTASGGPFRGYTRDMLEKVTLKQALNHPNWSMGKKITIDSATLMNKGLEVIEARWLFDMDYDHIDVLVHPQSIIHSMVRFRDKSHIAQLGAPDMRIPIQYALTYPERQPNEFMSIDFTKTGSLEFQKPDMVTFRALGLAYEAGRQGGTMPCVMNAANEEAVELFLKKEVSFTRINDIIEYTMDRHTVHKGEDIEEILEWDRWARKTVADGGFGK